MKIIPTHSSSSDLLRMNMNGFPPGGSSLHLSDLHIPRKTIPSFPSIFSHSGTRSPQFKQGGPFLYQSSAGPSFISPTHPSVFVPSPLFLLVHGAHPPRCLASSPWWCELPWLSGCYHDISETCLGSLSLHVVKSYIQSWHKFQILAFCVPCGDPRSPL